MMTAIYVAECMDRMAHKSVLFGGVECLCRATARMAAALSVVVLLSRRGVSASSENVESDQAQTT